MAEGGPRETSGSGSAKTASFSLQPIVTLEQLGGAALTEKKTGARIVNLDFRRLASHLKKANIDRRKHIFVFRALITFPIFVELCPYFYIFFTYV